VAVVASQALAVSLRAQQLVRTFTDQPHRFQTLADVSETFLKEFNTPFLLLDNLIKKYSYSLTCVEMMLLATCKISI
jgi:hypothetical protein